jgi:hypothetical protein
MSPKSCSGSLGWRSRRSPAASRSSPTMSTSSRRRLRSGCTTERWRPGPPNTLTISPGRSTPSSPRWRRIGRRTPSASFSPEPATTAQPASRPSDRRAGCAWYRIPRRPSTTGCPVAPSRRAQPKLSCRQKRWGTSSGGTPKRPGLAPLPDNPLRRHPGRPLWGCRPSSSCSASGTASISATTRRGTLQRRTERRIALQAPLRLARLPRLPAGASGGGRGAVRRPPRRGHAASSATPQVWALVARDVVPELVTRVQGRRQRRARSGRRAAPRARRPTRWPSSSLEHLETAGSRLAVKIFASDLRAPAPWRRCAAGLVSRGHLRSRLGGVAWDGSSVPVGRGSRWRATCAAR